MKLKLKLKLYLIGIDISVIIRFVMLSMEIIPRTIGLRSYKGDFYEGSGGGTTLLDFLLILGGLVLLEFLHWLSFSEFIGIASKVL